VIEMSDACQRCENRIDAETPDPPALPAGPALRLCMPCRDEVSRLPTERPPARGWECFAYNNRSCATEAPAGQQRVVRARDVKEGEWVSFHGLWAGPIDLVEENDQLPGSWLLNWPGGTWELPGVDEVTVVDAPPLEPLAEGEDAAGDTLPSLGDGLEAL
jgi:hypothetical protein